MTVHSLAVCSLKGGVGKTTIALNLAFAFARRGIRTLLVDTDPQGAIGLSLMGSARLQSGLAGLVFGAAQKPDIRASFIPTKLPGFSLLPMGQVHPIDIDAFADDLGRSGLLSQLLKEAEGFFDLVIFDTPAGLGGTTRKVLEAVEHVLLPVQCEPLSLRALPGALELLTSLRERGAKCSLVGLVANMSSFRDPVMLAVLEEVWSLYARALIDTSIPRDQAFLEASRAGVPVGLLARRPPPVAMTFDKLAAELEGPLGVAEGDSDDKPISLLD